MGKQCLITQLQRTKAGIVLAVVVREQEQSEEKKTADFLQEPMEKTHHFLISEKSFRSLRLRAYEIDEELFERIGEAHILYQAVRKGMELISYADQNSKTMIHKLKERGYDGEIARRAAQELTEMGWIREHQQAQRMAELCVRKQRGPGRIQTDLYQKGFSRQAIEAAMTHIRQICDFDQLCAEAIRKKRGTFPKDRQEQQKLIQFLRRNGFDSTQIRCAQQILAQENDM